LIGFKNSFSYKDYASTGKYFVYEDKLWVEYGSGAYIKYPLFDFDVPLKQELNTVFRNTKAILLSYSITSSDKDNNAWLYLCKDFNLALLKDNFKRNVKKAEKLFLLRIVNKDEVEKTAYNAYRDTRIRLGLSDYDKHSFLKRFSAQNLRPNSYIVGAFMNNKLAAYASVLAYHDFLEVEGLFSCNDYLMYRPNDLIIYNILDTALNVDKLKLVSYGFSTIQDNTNEEGLHYFKLKCGFEAVPVKRVFIINPKHKWFINIFTKKLIKIGVILFPKNIKIRKINGIINNL
jgi:hypothetical protein